MNIYIYVHICVCFRGWQAIQAISVPGAQTEGSGGAWAIQGFPKMGTFLQQNIGFPLNTFPTAWSLALVLAALFVWLRHWDPCSEAGKSTNYRTK
jgi:hypothetical protein